MQLGVQDLKKLLAYGVGGAVIATAYEAVEIFSRQRIPLRLSVETEQLHRHSALMVLLQNLESSSLSSRQQVLFTKLVDALDRMLHVKFVCGSQDRTVLESARSCSLTFVFTQFKRCQRYCNGIVSSGMSSQPVSQIYRLQDLTKKIQKHGEDLFYDTYQSLHQE